MSETKYQMPKARIPELKLGYWTVERFTVTEEAAKAFNMRQAFQGQARRAIDPGEYTRLIRNKTTTVMSDTPAELRDHQEWLEAAKGHCLIAGLGLGIAVEAALQKEEVKSVTVVERDPVIATHIPQYFMEYANRLVVIRDDIKTWEPPVGAYYDAVWLDIWDSICGDNEEEIEELLLKFDGISGWIGAWCEEEHRAQNEDPEDFEEDYDEFDEWDEDEDEDELI